MASIFEKVLEQKRALIYRRKEFNSYLIGLEHTHGRHFFVRQDCALRKIEKGGGFCEGELNGGFTVDFLVA